MEDPFDFKRGEFVLQNQSVDGLGEEERNWKILCLAQAKRMSGYHVGYLVDPSSYERKRILEAYKILDMGTNDAQTKLYRMLDKSITLIILGHDASSVILLLNSNLNDQEKDDTSIHLAYGLAYAYLRDFPNAEVHLKHTTRAPKSEWEAWWANRYISIIYDLQGKFAEEEQYLKNNISLKPDYPYFYEHYGRFLCNRKRYDEALITVEKGLQLGNYPVLIDLLHSIQNRE
jgi:tetratricopeptide (TPR) repeat protein